MAPDNWTYCPNCVDAEKKMLTQVLEKVKAKYGKVPVDDFVINYKTAVTKLAEVERTETLKEYTDLGMTDDGQLMINYQASCDRCNIKWKYKKKVEIQSEERK